MQPGHIQLLRSIQVRQQLQKLQGRQQLWKKYKEDNKIPQLKGRLNKDHRVDAGARQQVGLQLYIVGKQGAPA